MSETEERADTNADARMVLTPIRVERTHGNRSDADLDDIVGIGCVFPSGDVIVEWNQGAFPPENQMRGNHRSYYETVADLRDATSHEAQFDMTAIGLNED